MSRPLCVCVHLARRRHPDPRDHIKGHPIDPIANLFPANPKAFFCDRNKAKSPSFLNAKPCFFPSRSLQIRDILVYYSERRFCFQLPSSFAASSVPFFRSPTIPSSIVRGPIVFEMCQILTILHASYLSQYSRIRWAFFVFFVGFRRSFIFLLLRPLRLDPDYCLRCSEYCSSARGENRAPCIRY